MATTISLYEAIGRNIGDIDVQGQVASATATQIDSTVLIHPVSEQLKGREVYIYEGGGAAQSRIVTNLDPTNNRLSFGQPFTTVPSTNAKFILFKHFHVEDYENAMNRAIGWIRLKHLDEKVATMQLVATQYEYPVPSGFEYISNVRIVPSGHTDYSEDDEVSRIFELPPRYWDILPNAHGSYMIKFDARKIDLEVVDKEWANILGQVKPDFGATQISEDLQEYIINSASMLLSSQRISKGQEWRDKFRAFRDINNTLENYIHSTRYGRRVGG